MKQRKCHHDPVEREQRTTVCRRCTMTIENHAFYQDGQDWRVMPDALSNGPNLEYEQRYGTAAVRRRRTTRARL